MKLFIKAVVLAVMLSGSAFASGHGKSEMQKGLNVVVTSSDVQTQTMAMVLATMTVKKHKKQVYMTLCGPAAALADKEVQSAEVKTAKGVTTPKKMMMGLIQAGASVQVCPLYLPNAGKDASVLVDGVSVAKPPMVAAKLLDEDLNSLTF